MNKINSSVVEPVLLLVVPLLLLLHQLFLLSKEKKIKDLLLVEDMVHYQVVFHSVKRKHKTSLS